MVAATTRAEPRFVGVIVTERVTYFALAGKAPARFVQLGERVEGWQLVAYDQRAGSLSLRREEQVIVLLLPRGQVRDPDPLARAYRLAADGDKAVGSMLRWMEQIAALKGGCRASFAQPGKGSGRKGGKRGRTALGVGSQGERESPRSHARGRSGTIIGKALNLYRDLHRRRRYPAHLVRGPRPECAERDTRRVGPARP